MGRMPCFVRSSIGCAALLVVGLSGSAHAQATQSVSESIGASAYPTAFVARPINLRAGMIRLDARYQHLQTGSAETNQLAFGAAVGIVDSFELGITHARTNGIDYFNEGAFVTNLGQDGSARFGDMAIYGRYSIVDAEDFRLSGEISVVVPLHDASYWQFAFGLPLRARVAERFALDFLPEVRFAFGETATGRADNTVSMNIPIAGVLQPHSNVWIAGRSGLYWPAFDFEAFYFPGLLEAGVTVDHAGRAIMDISVQGGFPQLFTPGAADPVVTELWVLRLNLQGYLAF